MILKAVKGYLCYMPTSDIFVSFRSIKLVFNVKKTTSNTICHRHYIKFCLDFSMT